MLLGNTTLTRYVRMYPLPIVNKQVKLVDSTFMFIMLRVEYAHGTWSEYFKIVWGLVYLLGHSRQHRKTT